VTAENARTDEDEPTGDVVAVRAALALAAGLLCGFLAARYGHTDIWADVLAGWIAGVLSLGAVGCLLGAGSKSGLDRLQEAGVSVASIVVAWVAVHTVFAVHYAHLYYSGTEGGIDLNQKPKPRYTDFAYVAFTIGMAYAVSDTALEDSGIRRVALWHSVVSYLFGAVILAATVNLIVGGPK
jgi:uncharacterized membrane protein